MVEPSLVGVFHAVEARGPGDSVLSAWQFKDSGGRWRGVALASDEVVVVMGRLLQHACAGLVRPGCRRVVGDPFSSSGSRSPGSTRQGVPPTQPWQGRRQLHFELLPRPAAVLDLRRQLQAAGHTVSSRQAAARLNAAIWPLESKPLLSLCMTVRFLALCSSRFAGSPPSRRAT